MPAALYLVAQMPGMHTPGIDFTAKYPACVIDLATARMAKGSSGAPVMDSVIVVRDAGAALPELVAGLEQAYGAVRTVEREGGRDLWMASLRIPVPAVSDSLVRKMIGFFLERGLDMWWVRAEQGQAFLRTQVPADQDAYALADQLRGFLDAVGVDGDVAVEAGSPSETLPWRELVQRIRKHTA